MNGNINKFHRKLIFDLDGTLVKLNVDWKKIKEIVSNEFKIDCNSLTQTLLRFNLENKLKAIDIIRTYEKKSFSKWQLNYSLINWIKKNSPTFEFFLLSNNTSDTIKQFLEISELQSYFKNFVSLDKAKFPKPDNHGLKILLGSMYSERNQFLIIGDGKNDELLAENNGINCIIKNWFENEHSQNLEKYINSL